MKDALDISYPSLFAGYALLLIPIIILWYYKTGLIKDTIIAVIRMTIQLLLVGVYLEYIFKINSYLINIAWVLVMAIIASYTIVKRSDLSLKHFFLPIFLSGLLSIAVTDAYFLGFIIKLDSIFDARYFIPITGMLLGNTIRTVIIALDEYYGKMRNEQNFYRWHLANGATKKEALQPFMKSALRKAFNPVIATTAIMGLISLPGMMTGQILGGSSPNVAIKYQIMLMITIFSSGIINVFLTIVISNRFTFDKLENFKEV